jgi:hypothetical protein
MPSPPSRSLLERARVKNDDITKCSHQGQDPGSTALVAVLPSGASRKQFTRLSPVPNKLSRSLALSLSRSLSLYLSPYLDLPLTNYTRPRH